MPIVSQGTTQEFRVGATDGIFVKCTGSAAIMYDGEYSAPTLADTSTGEVRCGYFGVPATIRVNCVSGTCEVNTQPTVIKPLISKQGGAAQDSSALDVAQAVNGLSSVVGTSLEKISFTAYGAVSDGTGDNTSALLAALSSAVNKTLYVPAGEYRFTVGNVVIDNITPSNGNTISIVADKDATFIFEKEDLTHTSYVEYAEGQCIFELKNFSVVNIDGLSFVGVTTYGNVSGGITGNNWYGGAIWGVKMRFCRDISISNLLITGFNYRGFAINDRLDSEAQQTNSVAVKNCKGIHNRGSGFWVINTKSVDVEDCEFTDNGLEGTTGTGYSFTCSDKVTSARFFNCKFYKEWGKCIDSHGFGNLLVESCTFEDAGKAMIGWAGGDSGVSAYVDDCLVVIKDCELSQGRSASSESWLRNLYTKNKDNGFYNRQGMLTCYGTGKVKTQFIIENCNFYGCYNGWDVPYVPTAADAVDNRVIGVGYDNDDALVASVLIKNANVFANKFNPFGTGSSTGGEIIYFGKNVNSAEVDNSSIYKSNNFTISGGAAGCVIRSYYDESTRANFKVNDCVVALEQGVLFRIDPSKVFTEIVGGDISFNQLASVVNNAGSRFNDFGPYGLSRSTSDFAGGKVLLSARKIQQSGRMIQKSRAATYNLAAALNLQGTSSFSTNQLQIGNGTNFTAGQVAAYIYLDNVGLFDLSVTVAEGVYGSALSPTTASISCSNTGITNATVFNSTASSAKFSLSATLVELSNIKVVEVRVVSTGTLLQDLLITANYTPRVYQSFGILTMSPTQITSF